MGVLTDAKQADIEDRNIFAEGFGKFLCVTGSCGVDVVAVLLAKARHVVDLLWERWDVIEQGSAGAGFIALRITCWQESFVRPPEVHACPVDRRRSGIGQRCLQSRGSTTAAGERNMGDATRGLRISNRGNQSRTDCRCKRVVVGVRENLLIAGHFEAFRFALVAVVG